LVQSDLYRESNESVTIRPNPCQLALHSVQELNHGHYLFLSMFKEF
jgi:hypothetical protein